MSIIPKVLSEALVDAAVGAAKNVLSGLLTSVKGGNQGTIVPIRYQGHSSIICFVHGFCGDPLQTFHPLPSYIENEEKLQGWDIISIGYSTNIMPNIGKGIWSATPDINKISDYLVSNLELIFKGYSQVVLIGHSMGGLVLQKAMIKLQNINPVTHVLLFGTPSGGLKKAWFLKWFKNQIGDMAIGSQFIVDLRAEWSKKFEKGYPFYFRVIAGEMDEFVPTLSSLEPFPKEFHEITSGDHISMVKPQNISDTTFQLILKAILPETEYLSSKNYVQLNNLIAKYHEVVNDSKNRVKDLDTRGLKNYVFALEGLGQIDESIKVLKASPLIETNTDLMGFLGGRYKRKYLSDFEASDLNQAISWYQKALDISEANKNSMQIYYHAINLAFLFVMRDEQEPAAKEKMANLALKHLEISTDKNFWWFASKAEAHLYLDNLEEAKKNYPEAIKLAGNDIRAISSMYMNAIYACNAMNKEGWGTELLEIFKH